MRESDTLARMGGDEFVVVLSGIADEQDAMNVAKKLLTAMSQPFKVKQQEFTLSASMGVSFYPKDASDATSLIKSADISMYQAKEHGRNMFKVFEEEMTHSISRRLEMEGKMRKALEKQEFVLYYQPLIDLKNNRIMGMEALMRWNDPEVGLISPMDFIPIAEEDGLIVPMGEWALIEACEQLRTWLDMGFENLEMAVNMSGKQLSDPNVIDSVRRAFMGACVDPKFLEIELTETVLLDNAEEAIIKLQGLKDLGVRLAIDDFGTGYSSLNYLKRFPVDKLKIDQSFVRDIMTDDNDKGIVKAVINLAGTLHLDVLAEGVETPEQLSFLRAAGCDQLQGFLFSKPVKAEEFTELLKNEKEQLAILMK
jgi:predicted signal transduction protein with EAL and GGDEF domain